MMVSMGDTSAHGALFGVEWSDSFFCRRAGGRTTLLNMASTDWNLLEVVYDGAKQKGYLNGVLRGTASAS